MGASLDAILSSYWNLPKVGATPRVATSKTRQIMVFLVQNISLYSVHDFDSDH